MEPATSDNRKKLISSFIEIAVGQTMETAIQFLEATRWNLGEAINLFLIDRQNQPLCKQNSSEKYWSDYQEEEHIPPPLPSVRDTLYDYSYMNQTPVEVCPEEIWKSKPEPSGSDSVVGSHSEPEHSDLEYVVGSDSTSLSSLYRPPRKLLFKGSFEEAKSTSSKKDLWLIVNLQSTTEFASHTLNRDLWSNDAVSEAVQSSFILWQVYDDTTEGKKISTFYKIESAPPVVLLIDPITGQRMRIWRGAIEAHGFMEDLMMYMDQGPHGYIACLTSRKRMKTEKTCFESNQTIGRVVAPSWGSEFEKSAEEKQEKTCSSRNHIGHVVAPSWGSKFEKSAQVKEEETCSSSNHIGRIVVPSLGPEFKKSAEVKQEETCLDFPDLTEEPKGDCDRSIVCSLCVRFPDGRRKQRRFLKSEPIQLLWSFCYSQLEESERKAFKLVQAIPGASKTLEYGANATFDQSGLANSMISVTWE